MYTLKVSGPFGGDVGRMGEICGAISGALMVLDLKHASVFSGEEEKLKVYVVVKEFINCFKERYGTILCWKLLKCDLSTPEGLKYSKENKLVVTLCPNFIRDASGILEQLL